MVFSDEVWSKSGTAVRSEVFHAIHATVRLTLEDQSIQIAKGFQIFELRSKTMKPKSA
jgi:metal-dependent HD superfamily phosphatase/phosphodiesterase